MEEVTKSVPEPRIDPLAQPFRAIVYHDYKHLREVLDSYWRANEAVIVNNLKIKTQKLSDGSYKNAQQIAENNFGIRKIYHEILWDESKKKLENERILFIEALDIRNFKEGEIPYTIINFYKEPIFKLKKDINFTVTRQAKWDKEELKESRIRQLQRKHRTTHEVPSGEITDDCKVLLDLAYKSNSKLDVRNKWYELESLSGNLKDQLLSHKKGDSFELTLQEDGQDLEVIVQVHEVHQFETLSVEESLKAEGFESLEDFEIKFDEAFNDDLKRSDQALAVDHIIQELATKSELPPVPQSYIDINVNHYVDEHFAKFKNKEQGMLALGANDDDQVWRKFESEVMRKLLQDTALKTFADLYDIDRSDYNAIVEEIYTACNFVDPE